MLQAVSYLAAVALMLLSASLLSNLAFLSFGLACYYSIMNCIAKESQVGFAFYSRSKILKMGSLFSAAIQLITRWVSKLVLMIVEVFLFEARLQCLVAGILPAFHCKLLR